MTRQELEETEAAMMALVVRRRALGGFDVNAADIQFLAEVNLNLVRHLKERARNPRKDPE